MSYSISSKKIDHPLLKPILEKLTGYFSSIDVKFYVIGAIARDIFLNIYGERSGRATRDLDIAIAISNWDEYRTIEKDIVNMEDFEKDKRQTQRFIFRKFFELDIVPYGDIVKKDDKIFFPPDEQFAMSVLGFAEVNQATEKVVIDNNLSINIATLAGVFILKIVAWSDRHHATNKDADDIAFIITNYLNINDKRDGEDYYDEIYLDDKFSVEIAGAKLLGIDAAIILKDYSETKSKLSAILDMEIEKAEKSKLINQIIETNTNYKYEKTLQCLKNIVIGLND